MALKIKFNAPVILSFALISTVIFFLDKPTGGGLMKYFTSYSDIDVAHPITFFQLVSHIFGHISLEHLLGNMTFVLLLGPIVEEKYGSMNTIIMIVVTAIITGLLNVFFFNTGLLGASGIVFMLILLVSFTNVNSGEIPITFILVALLFIGKEFINGIKADNVSQFAHIIGGFCGSVFGFAGFGRKRLKA